MATIWTRRGCVLSVTFEDRTCDFQTKQHILSVSFALFFSLFWAENRVSKKAVLSRASALSRGARMRDVLSKDRGGIEQRVVLRVLSMLLFARLQTARTSNDAYVATRFSRSFYPNGDERRRRDLPRRNASAETTTKPTVPYFWSAQSLSVARETRTIRKRPTSFVYVFEAVVGYKKCDEKCRLSPFFFSSFERSLRESFKG